MRRTMSVSLLVAGFLLAPAMADDETARERAGNSWPANSPQGNIIQRNLDFFCEIA